MEVIIFRPYQTREPFATKENPVTASDGSRERQ